MSTQTSRILAEHQLQQEGNWPDERRRPPWFVIDREAERKLTGGFRTAPSNICPECFTTRSTNGTCGCIS